MRVLQLHVDYAEYYPVNTEIKEAEPDVIKEKNRIEEVCGYLNIHRKKR